VKRNLQVRLVIIVTLDYTKAKAVPTKSKDDNIRTRNILHVNKQRSERYQQLLHTFYKASTAVIRITRKTNKTFSTCMNMWSKHMELTDNVDVQGLPKNPTPIVQGVEAPEVSRILQKAMVPALKC
jgi:hypothetical protein